MIITLIVAFIVFCLLWAAIQYIPAPAGFPSWFKSVLYVLLLLVAAWYLWTRFGG